MRMVYIDDEIEQLKFARKAAKEFSKDSKMYSFSYGELKPGTLLALRWGLLDDCVLVVRLYEIHRPTNYQNLVKRHDKASS